MDINGAPLREGSGRGITGEFEAEPMPPPSTCTACGQYLDIVPRSASKGVGSAVVAAATSAALAAMDAAFPQLQEAVLKAVSKACEDIIRGRSVTIASHEEWLLAGVVSTNCGAELSELGVMAEGTSSRSVERLAVSEDPGRGGAINMSDGASTRDAWRPCWSLGSQCSRKVGAGGCKNATRVFSMDSGLSVRKFPGMQTSTADSLPTVQSLEANLAQTLLQNAGFRARGGAAGARGVRAFESDGSSNLSQWARWPPRAPAEPTTSDATGIGSDCLAKVMPTEERRVTASLSGDLPGEVQEANLSDTAPEDDWSPPRRRLQKTSTQILKERVRELSLEASAAGDGASDIPDSSGVPVALLLFGVLPWAPGRRPRASAVYQWFVRLVVLFAAVMFFLPSSAATDSLERCSSTRLCWQHGVLGQLPLPIGAVLVLLQFVPKRHSGPLLETYMLLHDVALQRGLEEWIARQSCVEKLVFVGMWLCIVTTEFLSHYFDTESMSDAVTAYSPFHIFSMGIFSASILCVTYGMVYVCRSLSTMIDAFCCDVVGDIKLEDVAQYWNLTQATLRRSSNAVEHCLLVLVVVLAFTGPFLLIDGGLLVDETSIDPLLAGLLVTCAILYVLLLAALVSEKCSRVPALINAISFGPSTDSERQRVVDYVVSSAAGFYVFGTRLTTSAVVKLLYVWCIVAVGLITRLVSADGRPVFFNK